MWVNSAGAHLPASRQDLGSGSWWLWLSHARLSSKKVRKTQLGHTALPQQARQNPSVSPCPTLLLGTGCTPREPLRMLHARCQGKR